MDITTTSPPRLRDYAWLVVNSSAGKDSQAMLDVVAQQAKAGERPRPPGRRPRGPWAR